jgi:glycosidase
VKKVNKQALIIFTLIAVVLCFMKTTNVMAIDKISQKDMIYFVFTDRFYDGDKTNNQGVSKANPSAYHGGDFQGIIDKLDYISGLGFTTIWISPVVENDENGYHGYWTKDFYKTNEHFGTMEKLKELVNKAHEKNIKVMFDLVVNHTGEKNPWAFDSEHKGWFHPQVGITDYNNQSDVENGWLYNLPDFNTENPKVQKYLIDMAKWWIKETGIDGYRLDTVRHVPKAFWKEFSNEIKKDYPDFFLLGEVFNDNVEYLAGYQNTGIDGLVDFPAYSKITAVFKEDRTAEALAKLIKEASTYKNKNLMGTFIDNHDVQRFVNNIYNLPTERTKCALAFMYTYTGIPVMYYGDEIAMAGGNDPDNRRDMDFAAAAKSPVTNYVKKLAEIRKSNPALTDGNIEVLSSTPNILCFARQYKNNTVIVAFNTSSEKQKLEVKLPEKYNGSTLKELTTETDIKLADGKINFELAPMQANIYQVNNNNSMLLYAFIGFDVVVIVAAMIISNNKKKKKKQQK